MHGRDRAEAQAIAGVDGAGDLTVERDDARPRERVAADELERPDVRVEVVHDGAHLEAAPLGAVLARVERAVILDRKARAGEPVAREEVVDVPALGVDEPDAARVAEVDEELHDLGARDRGRGRPRRQRAPRLFVRDRVRRLPARRGLDHRGRGRRVRRRGDDLVRRRGRRRVLERTSVLRAPTRQQPRAEEDDGVVALHLSSDQTSEPGQGFKPHAARPFTRSIRSCGRSHRRDRRAPCSSAAPRARTRCTCRW